MSEQQLPPEPVIIPPAEEPFDPEEHIANLYTRFNENLRNQANSSVAVEESSSPALNSPEGAAEPATAAPVEPAQPEQTADYWRQRYDSLQSDMDRRVNKGVEKVREELGTKIDTLLAVITRGGMVGQMAPQAPQSFNEASQDPQQLDQYFDTIVERKLASKLNSDPRVAAGQVVTDLAKFQQEYPDYQHFYAVMEPALKRFPVRPGESNYERLVQAYEFAKDLYTQAAAAAKQTGGAVGANGKTTTPQPPATGRVTGEQADALRNRAATYPNERGVSATIATKPTIDPYDPRKLRQNVETLIGPLLK